MLLDLEFLINISRPIEKNRLLTSLTLHERELRYFLRRVKLTFLSSSFGLQRNMNELLFSF